MGMKILKEVFFLTFYEYRRIRGQEVALVEDQCRLDIKKYPFSLRTLNEWNKLSTECVNASSVTMFQNKIHKYPRRSGYTTFIKNCALDKPMTSVVTLDLRWTQHFFKHLEVLNNYL